MEWSAARSVTYRTFDNLNLPCYVPFEKKNNRKCTRVVEASKSILLRNNTYNEISWIPQDYRASQNNSGFGTDKLLQGFRLQPISANIVSMRDGCRRFKFWNVQNSKWWIWRRWRLSNWFTMYATRSKHTVLWLSSFSITSVCSILRDWIDVW